MAKRIPDVTPAQKIIIARKLEEWGVPPIPEAQFTPAVWAAMKSLVDKSTHLEELALIDDLTRVYNARAYNIEIERAIALRRHREDLIKKGKRDTPYPTATVVMVDINNFKQFNDQHSHACGDAALRHLAGLLRESMHKEDFIARIGGDEFAIICYGTKPEEIADKLVRLAEIIETTLFEFDNKKFSIGIAYGSRKLETNDTPEKLKHDISILMKEHKQSVKSPAKDEKEAQGSWWTQTVTGSNIPGNKDLKR